MKSNTIRPFGLRDKLGYFCGDFANNLLFMMAGSFLTVFYVNVLNISPTISATMFLISRFVDAFSDIAMGQLVDRAAPAKDGKFRPWIRRMAGPVAISSFLMYQSGLAGISMPLKIAYMFSTYLLFGSVFYTAINIPYGSMASAVTANPKERASLSTFRSLGGTLGAILVSVIAPQLLYEADAQGNQIVSSSGFLVAAGIFAALAIALYLICYFFTTERVNYESMLKEKQPGILEILKLIVNNRAFLALVGASVLLLLSTTLNQTISAFLYKDYFNDVNPMSVSGLISVPIALLLAPMTAKLSGRFGKKEASAVGMLFAGGVYLVLFAVKITNPWVYVVVHALTTLGTTFFNMVIWAMVADVIDYQELKAGTRADGTIYGGYSFARKIGQALAGGLAGYALAFIGYNQNAAIQTQEVKQGIYGLSTLLMGAIIISVGLLLIFAYPLNKKVVASNAQQLEAIHHNKQ